MCVSSVQLTNMKQFYNQNFNIYIYEEQQTVLHVDIIVFSHIQGAAIITGLFIFVIQLFCMYILKYIMGGRPLNSVI